MRSSCGCDEDGCLMHPLWCRFSIWRFPLWELWMRGWALLNLTFPLCHSFIAASPGDRMGPWLLLRGLPACGGPLSAFFLFFSSALLAFFPLTHRLDIVGRNNLVARCLVSGRTVSGIRPLCSPRRWHGGAGRRTLCLVHSLRRFLHGW